MDTVNTGRSIARVEAPTGQGEQAAPYQGGFLDMHMVEKAFVALLNHKVWVIGSILACLSLGLVATFLMTPLYTSTSRIEISPQAPVETDVKGAREKTISNEIAFFNTQYSLLESRSLAARTVRAGNLLNDKDFLAHYDLTGGEEGAPNSAQRTRMAERAEKILLDAVSIEPVRQSSLVDVSFATPSPALSAKLTNLWVQQFIAANLDRRFAATSDARRFLEQRISSLRRNLEDSERELITYAANNDIITLESRSDPASGRSIGDRTLVAADVEKISTALSAARDARIAAESHLSSSVSSADVSSNASVSALRQKRAELTAELARLTTTFGEEYPEVVAKRQQLAALSQSVAAETQRLHSFPG